jgi:hypothetical protein
VAANSALRLGYLDLSRQLLIEALDIAEKHGTPYNQGFVHMFAIVLYSTLRDPQKVLGHADTLNRLAESNPMYSSFADAHAGAALFMIGKRGEGLARMRRALASSELGPDLPNRLALEVQSCANEGRAQDGLAAVDEGLRAAAEMPFYRSSFLRQRADLFLQAGVTGPKIEVAFREAIECARGQGNRFDELESTIRFARWLNPQGRAVEARAMLAEIYDWFTEGFDTIPLKEAKALLEELSTRGACMRGHA